MRNRFATLLSWLTLASVAGVLSGCGTPPPAPMTTPVPQNEPVANSVAPSPTPTPTPEPNELEPGTNHSRAAAAYTYHAQDVHAWLTQGPTARDYPQEKVVFLTFDDGPNNTTTRDTLKVLKDKGVHATFFYITNKVGLATTDPAVPKQVIAEGHSIDIHSHSHNYGYLYPGRRGNVEHIIADREQAIGEVRKVLGNDYQVHGYRYPGGHMSWKNLEAADQALAERGAYWLDWNAMNGDAEQKAPTSAAGMVQMVDSTMRESGNPNCAVVLMHDAQGMNLTTKALPQVIDNFKERGYQFGIIN